MFIKLKGRRWILSLLVAMMILWHVSAATAQHSKVLRDMDTVWSTVWDEYVDLFYNGVDWHRLPDEVRPKIQAAETELDAYRQLAEMVDRLNDPSTFLVAPQPYVSAVETEYAGIGVVISSAVVLQNFPDGAIFDNELDVAIVEVFGGAPAADAGLLPGDVIVKIDDWDAAGADLDDISDRIRGEIGTIVNVTVRDPGGEERVVSVERNRIDLQAGVQFERIADDVGLLRMDTLQLTHARQAKQFIAANAMLDTIVLDLRDVDYGEPAALAEIAGWFIGDVDLGAFESRYDRFSLPRASEGIRPIYNGNVIVLVHEGTGGLGEILALLLDEYDRGTIVGTQPLGGFSLTRLVQLPSGWGLNLSLARYVSPQGQGVHADGLTPHIVVDDITIADMRRTGDPLLERVIADVIHAGE